ncbi:MAG: hypothetical protein OEY23_03765, partial [Acidimicrobiia bacterium]|nr:hypothetical protein [Acidimicrobiia bacterium]
MSVALLPRRGRLRRTLVAALVPLGLALALLVDGSPVVGAAPSPTPGRAAPLPSAGGPAFAALAPTPSPANGAAVPGPLDLDSLDEEPVRHWGVVGTGLTDTKSKPYVWDFAEIGDRIYVAGTFTGVQEYGFDPASVVFPQAYLAAFDRDSGEWIPEFAPHLNRTVYALAVSPSGNLLVGGEFDTVNGAARAGLVMVDPQTGATVAGFSTEVAAFEPGERGIVRELVVDGTDVYVAGDFSYFVRAGASNFVWNAVRIRADSGLLDPAWLPQFAGSVWDLAIDHGRGRVHAVGFFTSANASPDTNRFATVTQATGASVTGLPQLEFNTRGQIDTVAVAFAGDKIWVGGAQHLLQVLDGETNQRVGFSVMGGSCEDFIQSPCPFIGGGDYQVIEVFGDTVLAGCHCFRPSEQRDPANVVWDTINHYDSFSDSRSEQRAAIGYDASTGRVASPFIPGLAEDYHGIWALHVDANGCLFVGGYVNRTESGDWRGGFGKFCRPVPAPASLSGFSADETVRLSWDRPESQLPVDRYKVYSDGAFLGDTAGLSFT